MSASASPVGPIPGWHQGLLESLTIEIYCPDALGLSLTVDQSRTDEREPDPVDDKPDRARNAFHEVVSELSMGFKPGSVGGRTG